MTKPLEDHKPPGKGLIELAQRNPAISKVLEHMGVLQIAYDHFYEWSTASTQIERDQIRRRMRREVARALGSYAGFELSAHGIVALSFGEVIQGTSLLAVGALIVYLLSKGGGGS